MADVLLTLLFEDDSDTRDPVPPPMGSCGAELYRELRPFAREDHAHRWVLAHVCEAIGRMRQAVSDLVRDSDHGPGWSAALDVDRAPGADDEIDMLRLLALAVGVRLDPGLNDHDRRAALREREGFWRGRPDAIVSFARRFTDGRDGAAQLRERYDPSLGAGVDAPHHDQVLIKRAALLPGVVLDDLRAAVLAKFPAGRIVVVTITDEADYDDIVTGYRTYADIPARTTYTDLLED